MIVGPCEAALYRAERALDRMDVQPDVPNWLDFDRGGLAGYAARAYRDLGFPTRAHQFAAEAIGLCQDNHVRTAVAAQDHPRHRDGQRG